MERFALLALAVGATGFVLSWVVQRFNSRRGTELRLVADLMLRLVAVGLLIWAAERAASRGGWLVSVAVLLALTATMLAMLSLIPASALWLSLSGHSAEAEQHD